LGDRAERAIKALKMLCEGDGGGERRWKQRWDEKERN